METQLILGPGGSGKTEKIKRKIEEDPKWAIVTSTSGISAVNVGGTTINSTLGYFDTNELYKACEKGRVYGALRGLRDHGFDRIVIDEVSMLPARALDLLYPEFDRAGMGMVLVGDFLQLPPVNEAYAFQSQYWNQVSWNLEKLTKIYRQIDPSFLEAVSSAREARGNTTLHCLRKAKVRISPTVDPNFEGLTLFRYNASVEKYNRDREALLEGNPVQFHSSRWGQQRREWSLIPEVLELKEESLVMILANQREQKDEDGTIINGGYVNGDLGYLNGDGSVILRRNNRTAGAPVTVNAVVRKCYAPELTKSEKDVSQPKDYPKDPYSREYLRYIESMEMVGRPYFDPRADLWVVGEIEYSPLRLAYACTIHKAQGLTLDSVQIDFRTRGMGDPALAYVALTRCRYPEGLRLVGSEFAIAGRFVNNALVRNYI